MIGAAVPLVQPVKLFPVLPVYWIVSFAYLPINNSLVVSLEVNTFSITIYPLVGKLVASDKVIVVSESVRVSFNVVSN